MKKTAVVCLAIAAAAASAQTIVSYKPQLRVQPIANAPVAQYAVLDGATVSIDVGYVKNYDKLLVDYEGNFNVTNTWDATSGTLYLSGSASISEYAEVIESVVFLTTSADGNPRRITWTYGNYTLYLPATGHFYKLVKATGQTQTTWEEAASICAQANKMFLGMQGYLATVTSSAEMEGLGAKLTHSAWLGASNSMNPLQWVWKTGPEAGWPIWNGYSMYRNGSTAPNAYAAWGRFQPEPQTAERPSTNFLSLKVSPYEPVGHWYNSANSDGIQGYVCEYGGMDSADIAGMASSLTGTVTLELGCELFTTSGDCSNAVAFGCNWQGSTCAVSGCRQHGTQGACDRDSTCRWNVRGDLGRCVPTTCSQNANEIACAADNQCRFDIALGCVDAMCSDMRAQCDCAALSPDCMWDVSSGRCASKSSVDCTGTDTVYLIDSTAPMAGAFGNYPQGFRGLTNLFKSSDLTLTKSVGNADPGSALGQRFGFVSYGARVATSPAGTGSAGGITGKKSEIAADIAFLQGGFNGAGDQRTIAEALTTAKNMFTAGNSGSRKKLLVVVATGGLSDGAALRNAPTSVLTDLSGMGVTLFGVALRPTYPYTPDSGAAWSTLQQVCGASRVINATLDTFQANVIYGQCNRTTVFGDLAHQGVTVAMPLVCSNVADKPTCNSNANCAWSFSAGACTRSQCMNWCNQASCTADVTCRFSNGACVERCAGRTQSDCGTDATCSFVDGMCSPKPCVNNPTEDACIADPARCQFNASAATKCQPVPCVSHSTAQGCEGDASGTCSWIMGGCMANPCKANPPLNEFMCTGLPFCTWDASGSGVCKMDYCRQNARESTCSQNRDCMWDVTQSPPVCAKAPCVAINMLSQPEAACRANALCQWAPIPGQGETPLCQKKTCDMQLRACDCAATDGCVWRNDACKDNRYVQCPMTDVLFMVESTAAMKEDYGRHPNGFYGIVEAIRGWSRRAPIAADVTSTGFRVAMIGYGNSGNPFLAPQVNVDSGMPFVQGSGEPFFGPNQELDAYENGLDAYVQGNGNNSNAIKPALRFAKRVFERAATVNAAANDRKKLLVIIGSNPITDGLSGMNDIFREIESMGVQIFSNVVRRFSTITPNDLQAAEFIRPFASDPSSSHFLFTTIEDLTKQLLDDFCDPSTNTGIALQVSRNGVVPCSWLTSETECQTQSSCIYDANAVQSCPTPAGCPNLDCKELPAYLSKGFKCGDCKLVSGAFFCVKSNTPATMPRGLCGVTNCAKQCNTTTCSSAQSGGTTPFSCAAVNSGPTFRCEVDLCASQTASGMRACNGLQGCVWDTTGAAPTCRRSKCWSFRSQATCESFSVTSAAGEVNPCVWNSTFVPAICQESRCMTVAQSSTCGTIPGCYWTTESGTAVCANKICSQTTSLACRSDVKCYWDPFAPTPGGECKSRGLGECKLSAFGEWSPCPATCGDAVQFRQRRVLQFPTVGDCTQAIDAATGGFKQTKQCSTVAAGRSEVWPMDCRAKCAAHTSPSMCAADISCEWNTTCVPLRFQGCSGFRTATDCNAASDMCSWDATVGFCETKLKRCRSTQTNKQFDTATGCAQMDKCDWNTGADTIAAATRLGIEGILYNPGQPAIFPFPTLRIDDDQTWLSAATVVIEANYSRGKDKLVLSYPNALEVLWLPSSGVLLLSGNATVSQYATAIRFVTFQTTSTSDAPRVISWSFGMNVFSGVTKHHYTASHSGVTKTYAQAKSACEVNFFGLTGYLATINSAEENGVVSTKLEAKGWISGENVAIGQWQWTTGPEAGQVVFWTGGSILTGGVAVPSMYANWNPSTGEPAEGATLRGSHVYLNATGYWTSKLGDAADATDYVCEYGGVGTVSVSYPIGGAVAMGPGGCMAAECTWHTDENQCNLDPECAWTGNSCAKGCNARSTVGECMSASECTWRTDVVPPVCDTNPCAGRGRDTCPNDRRCTWDPTSGCRTRTGCAALTTSTDCDRLSSCSWNAATSFCDRRTCSSLGTLADCQASPLCEWNAGQSECQSSLCKYGTQSECTTDNRCSWASNQNGSLILGFAPGGAPVQVANGLASPGDATTPIDGVTVVVTQGFQPNQDELSIDAAGRADGTFTVGTFDAVRGSLVLTVQPGMTVTPLKAYRFLKAHLYFASSSQSPVTRNVSVTYSARTVYSSSQNAFLKYYRSTTPTTTFAAAAAMCAGTSLFGQTGRLAFLDAEIDSMNLGRLQAQGWIGGAAGATNRWMWTSSPTALTGPVFWEVTNNVGVPVPDNNTASGYRWAQWAAGQPKDATADRTRYVFVNDDGFWSTVYDGMVGIRAGVICSYANPNDFRQLQATRRIGATGCFPTPCLGLPENACDADPMCVWAATASNNATATVGTCGLDQWCAAQQRPSTCGRLELCYWDYTLGQCSNARPTVCSTLPRANCTTDQYPQCQWRDTILNKATRQLGTCSFRGCAAHGEAACSADPGCTWFVSTTGGGAGQCISRTCGYPNPSACWADTKCVWDKATSACANSPCLALTQAACATGDSCTFNAAADRCEHRRCGTTTGARSCQADPQCTWQNGACTLTTCGSNTAAGQTACDQQPNCFFWVRENGASTCQAAQCRAFTSLTDCEQNVQILSQKECVWENGACREPTFRERNAPRNADTCTAQVNPNLWWLWLLVGIIALLIILIIHRLYLAWAKGLSFFEPTKNTVKYSPHQQYASSIFEDAQKVGEETNVTTSYQKPAIDDL